MKDKGAILVAGIIVLIVAFLLFSSNPDEEPVANTPTPTGIITNTNVLNADMKQYTSEPAMNLASGVDYQAKLTTNKGVIVVDLYEDKTPKTVNNFVFLANDGFYVDIPIHRVIKGFMLQSGDPTGTGSGGPGYKFADEEFEGTYSRGTLAMANAGPNTNGSQFFIMHADYPLPPNYVIFGQVIEGLDIVDAIAETPVEANNYGELSVPTEELIIEKIEVIEA